MPIKPGDWLVEDKLWRLRNLYMVKRADTGQLVPFTPRPEQELVYKELLAGRRRLIILKARRLGVSTAIDIYAQDEVVFRAGFQASIVDRNEAEASLKLNNIVKVAYNSLPEGMRRRMRLQKANDSAFELQVGKDAISALYAGKNARGGTNQFLHISEWGVIQFTDPARSQEILTGAIPSAEHGTVVVETTWKGGQGGELWRLVEQALRNPNPGPSEWKVLFFPWWNDPSYTMAEGEIERDVEIYLIEKAQELKIQFTIGQARWYANARRTYDLYTYAEFPTTIDECFKAPIKGAIYADLIVKLMAAGRVNKWEMDNAGLVHTAWDLGSPLNQVTWYFQMVGFEIRLVDLDWGMDCTVTERVGRMLAKGYSYGFHFLPHDALAKENTGETYAGSLSKAGLSNVRCVPRTVNIWIGINHLRQIFPRLRFRVPATDRGIEALRCYHTNTESPTGLALDQPVHDWSSHFADALRCFAEADRQGMISSVSGHRPAVIAGVGGSLERDAVSGQLDPVDQWFRSIQVRPSVRRY